MEGVWLTTVAWRTEPSTKDFSSAETCCWTGGGWQLMLHVRTVNLDTCLTIALLTGCTLFLTRMVISEYTRPGQSAYPSSPPLWYVFQWCACALCASIDHFDHSFLPSPSLQSPPKVSPKAQVLPKKRIELPAIEQGRPETQPVSSTCCQHYSVAPAILPHLAD